MGERRKVTVRGEVNERRGSADVVTGNVECGGDDGCQSDSGWLCAGD